MYWKNWKKVDFAIFDPKKSRCLVGLGQISGKPVKIVKKWLYQLILGMFMDKVKNFCDHSMILWEMGANLLTDGTLWSPPASFRVKKKLQLANSFKMFVGAKFDWLISSNPKFFPAMVTKILDFIYKHLNYKVLMSFFDYSDI